MFGRKDLSSLLFSKLKFVKVESKLTSYKGILNIAHHTCNISILYLYFDFSVTYNACSCRCSEHLKLIGWSMNTSPYKCYNLLVTCFELTMQNTERWTCSLKHIVSIVICCVYFDEKNWFLKSARLIILAKQQQAIGYSGQYLGVCNGVGMRGSFYTCLVRLNRPEWRQHPVRYWGYYDTVPTGWVLWFYCLIYFSISSCNWADIRCKFISFSLLMTQCQFYLYLNNWKENWL